MGASPSAVVLAPRLVLRALLASFLLLPLGVSGSMIAAPSLLASVAPVLVSMGVPVPPV